MTAVSLIKNNLKDWTKIKDQFPEDFQDDIIRMYRLEKHDYFESIAKAQLWQSADTYYYADSLVLNEAQLWQLHLQAFCYCIAMAISDITPAGVKSNESIGVLSTSNTQSTNNPEAKNLNLSNKFGYEMDRIKSVWADYHARLLYSC